MTDLEKVKQDWRFLQHVENQTHEICLAAVKQDWRALEYVENQTPEICLEAVKQNWGALGFIRNEELRLSITIQYKTNLKINPKTTKWWL